MTTTRTTSRLALVLVLASPCLAAAAGPDQPDDRRYPLCTDLVPSWIWKKHLAGMSWRPTGITNQGTSCEFVDGGRRVTLVYECIKGRTFPRPKLNPPTEQEIPALGRFAFRTVEREGSRIDFVDDDTPCRIGVYPSGGGAVDALVALARDLAKATTPQVVDRETVEGLVWGIDETGTAAEDRMEVWRREGEGVKALVTLPPGFPQVTELPPRVADGKPRKALVLGYLHHRSLFDFVVEAVQPFLPGMDVERFAAEQRKPTPPPAMLALRTGTSTTLAQGKHRLAVAFASSGQGEYQDDLLVLYLHDANHRLLDWKKLDVLKEAPDTRQLLDPKRPEREHGPLCTWAVDEAGPGIVARIDCERNPDPENGHVRCKKNPTWTLRWDVGVKDDKLRIQRKRTVFRGKDCFEEGE